MLFRLLLPRLVLIEVIRAGNRADIARGEAGHDQIDHQGDAYQPGGGAQLVEGVPLRAVVAQRLDIGIAQGYADGRRIGEKKEQVDPRLRLHRAGDQRGEPHRQADVEPTVVVGLKKQRKVGECYEHQQRGQDAVEDQQRQKEQYAHRRDLLRDLQVGARLLIDARHQDQDEVGQGHHQDGTQERRDEPQVGKQHRAGRYRRDHAVPIDDLE